MSERTIPEALSVERIRQATETVNAALGETMHGGFPGAIGAYPFGAFCEAKRNLTALMQWLHGNDEWERLLEDDGVPDERP